MRQVAQYVFSASHDSAATGDERYASAANLVDGWATQKGWRGDPNFALPDGRSGEIDVQLVQSAKGSLKRWTLLEEITGGFFETMVGVAQTHERVHVSCSLSVGHNTNQLSPLRYEARCPSVLRQLLDLKWSWRLGKSSISTVPITFRGKGGGQAFVALLTDLERSLPVLALSSHYGLLLHREIDGRMARDLVALATVAVLDDEASWEATVHLGRNWSCYNGAIRLYWPGLKADGNPLNHPLWTSERLLNGPGTVDEAERRIRDTIRKRHEYAVRKSGATADEILGSYRTYVTRYSAQLGQIETEKLAAHPKERLADFIVAAAGQLITFIYTHVEQARRRSMNTMLDAAMAARTDQDLRRRILEYLQQTEWDERLDPLRSAGWLSNAAVSELLELVASPTDAAELRGASDRLLASYPDVPSVLLIRSVAEALCRDASVVTIEAQTQSAVRFALGTYRIDGPEVAATVAWAVRFLEDGKKLEGADAVVRGAMGSDQLTREFLRTLTHLLPGRLKPEPAGKLIQLLAQRLANILDLIEVP